MARRWYQAFLFPGHFNTHIGGHDIIVLADLLFFKTTLPVVGIQTDTTLNTTIARVAASHHWIFRAEHAPRQKIKMQFCIACVGPQKLAVILETSQVHVLQGVLESLMVCMLQRIDEALTMVSF